MFGKLTNFAYTRTIKEAIGFYLAYLVLTMLVAGVLAGLLGVMTGNNTYNYGVSVGTVISILVSMLISFLIALQRKQTNNFMYILLILLSGLLAYMGGGLLGLIPSAYLSTKK